MAYGLKACSCQPLMVVYPDERDQWLLYMYYDDIATVNGGSNAICHDEW